MTDTFRDLCAELLDELDFQTSHHEIKDLKARARAALAEGDGVGPSDEELDKTLFQALDEYMRQKSPFGGPTDQKQLDRAKARAVLARYGSHPRPIPVAERLPTEADCDAKGKVWTTDYDPRLVYSPEWNMTSLPPQSNFSEAYFWRNVRYWLPAAAIPLPEASP
jgi:hypothetical protein